jgi:hypothetical protein
MYARNDMEMCSSRSFEFISSYWAVSPFGASARFKTFQKSRIEVFAQRPMIEILRKCRQASECGRLAEESPGGTGEYKKARGKL